MAPALEGYGVDFKKLSPGFSEASAQDATEKRLPPPPDGDAQSSTRQSQKFPGRFDRTGFPFSQEVLVCLSADSAATFTQPIPKL